MSTMPNSELACSSSLWLDAVSTTSTVGHKFSGTEVGSLGAMVIDIVPVADSDTETEKSQSFIDNNESSSSQTAVADENACQAGIEADVVNSTERSEELSAKLNGMTTASSQRMNSKQAMSDLPNSSDLQALSSHLDFAHLEIVEILPETMNENEVSSLLSEENSAPANKIIENVESVISCGSLNHGLSHSSGEHDSEGKLNSCTNEGENKQGMEASGRSEPSISKCQGQGRGGSRFYSSGAQPGQKLERALNFLKQGANSGARKSESNKAKTQDSPLISYLTTFPSKMLTLTAGPEQSILPSSCGTVASVANLRPLSLNASTSTKAINHNLHAIPRLIHNATDAGLRLAVVGGEMPAQKPSPQTLPTSDEHLQTVSQTKKRKRKLSHTSVDLPQIPVQVKEEKIDDDYEAVSNSAKVVILDTSGVQSVTSCTSDGIPGDNLQQPTSVTSPSLIVASRKQRTTRSFQWHNFQASVTKNTSTPSVTAVGPVRFAAPYAPANSPKTSTLTRPNLSLLLGYPHPVAVTQVSTSLVNAVSANRVTNTLSGAVSNFITPKATASSAQSPLLIVVNKQQSGSLNLTSRVASTVLNNAQKTNYLSILSSSKPNSETASCANSNILRPLKVRPSNTNVALLTRKFQLLYKKSILPKHVAPKTMPESLHVSTPLKLVACAGCGDEFLTEKGLNDHYDRKSIVISFNCRCDKKTNIFYNMCSFARFYCEHTAQGSGLHSYKIHSYHDSCVMAMLPPCMMPPEYQKRLNEKEKQHKQTETITVTAENLPVPCSKTSSVVPAVSSSASASTATIVTLVNAQPQIQPLHEFFAALERHNTMCLECESIYKRRRGLSAHISGQRMVPDQSLLQCGKCFMVLPNVCSFKAHSRIHNKLEPYVCPECGLVFQTSRDVFMKHVKQVCLHFSRFLSRTCPFCKATLSHSTESIVAHLECAHTQTYYKCSDCSMAFSSEKAFKSHGAAEHSQSTVSKKIRKCPFCKVAEIGQQSLVQHISRHVDEAGFGLPCAFRCLLCLKNFSLRSDLVEHMKKVHPSEIITGSMCEVCGTVCENMVSLYGHIHANHSTFFKQLFELKMPCKVNPSVTKARSVVVTKTSTEVMTKDGRQQKSKKSFECDRCQMVLSDDEQYGRHMAKHRFLESKRAASKSLPAEKKDRKKQKVEKDVPADKSNDIKQEATESQGTVNSNSDETKFPAQSPIAASPSATKSCTKEQPKEEDSLVCWFSCHLCEKTFKNMENLQYHLKDTHTGKSRQYAYLCWICREQSELKSYPKAGMLIKHMKNFHKIARKNIDYGRIAAFSSKEEECATGDEDKLTRVDATQLNDVRKLRVEGELTYNCAKCEFFSTERELFLEHIQQHSQGDAHQCPECGVSFIVLPSLKRHLFVVHRVRDFDRYQAETGFSLEPPTVCEAESDPEGSFAPLSVTLNMSALDSSGQSNDVQNSPEKESNLECTVCYRKFDDDCTLRQHMRVHGMAFIQGSRRRSNMSRKTSLSDS